MRKSIHGLLMSAMRLALAGFLTIVAACVAVRWIETMVAAETAAMVAVLTGSGTAIGTGNRAALPVAPVTDGVAKSALPPLATNP